jgi:hypothetical protein
MKGFILVATGRNGEEPPTFLNSIIISEKTPSSKIPALP